MDNQARRLSRVGMEKLNDPNATEFEKKAGLWSRLVGALRRNPKRERGYTSGARPYPDGDPKNKTKHKVDPAEVEFKSGKWE